MVVFKKEDFSLCHVPVPSGYRQSQTHSGIAVYNGCYYLTSSPYPTIIKGRIRTIFEILCNKITRNKAFKTYIPEQYENPLLYFGNTERMEIPTSFTLLQSSPLMPSPDPYYGLPAFNSDPDVFIEDGIIHVLNRQVYRTKICPGEPLNKYMVRLYHIYGSINKDKFKYLGTELLFETEELITSPCLTKYKKSYVITQLDSNVYNDGLGFNGLYICRKDNISEFKRNINWTQVIVHCNDYLPWHMSLFQHEGRLYSIVACVKKGEKRRCWQLLGEFNDDLSELKIYKTPLTDYKSYRGTATVTEDGEFVLYSTTVQEKIKGSNSVDGRDVIMAHMSFQKLMTVLKESE